MNTKKIESGLVHKIYGKLNAVAGGNRSLKIAKGFTCWEAPTTNAVRASSANTKSYLETIRLAFITSLEGEGFVSRGRGWWELAKDGLFINIHVEAVGPALHGHQFEVWPSANLVRQNL